MKIRIPTDSLGGIFLALCLFGAFFAGVVGWVWNIAKIFQADTLTGMVLARVIGAVMFPVGAVMGYF
jgi:hypothetical protein